MSPDGDRLEAQLRMLRSEYLSESSRRVEELWRMHERLRAGERAALAELRQAFHRLAGSGGSYGFPQVSVASREGEQLGRQLDGRGTPLSATDLDSLGECIRGVAAAFEDARRRAVGSGPAEPSPD